MDLHRHLLELFRFNDDSNRRMIAAVARLPEPQRALELLSHLANSQTKWTARITQDPRAAQMDWWKPVYALDRLEAEWSASLGPWLALVEQSSEAELCAEVSYAGMDGGRWAATPKDIALQLNYHSIHHRAQLQTILRAQGLEPDFVDYIRTKCRKLDG